jgi:hypothetical protein
VHGSRLRGKNGEKKKKKKNGATPKENVTAGKRANKATK